MRLLTRKGTKPPRSKGMAFVEVDDAESAYQCLGLHHSRLDGRLLNVERTSGGGKVTLHYVEPRRIHVTCEALM